MRVYIRPARESDREAVLKFTEHTWEWGDYIADVWERWLYETRSRLLVATINRIPVGISHTAMVSETESWLEGMRVNPEFRRLNIATELTERSITDAVEFGANVMRFITSSENTPIHRIAAALGFRKTVVIRPMQAVPLKGRDSTPIIPLPEQVGEVRSFIENSESYRSDNGLYSRGWRFLRLTPEEIRRQVRDGNVRITVLNGKIEAALIVEPRWDRKAFGISYAGGDVEQLTRLASGLRSEAGEIGLQEINTHLPEMPDIITALEKAGYERVAEAPFWLFEKKLDASLSSN